LDLKTKKPTLQGVGNSIGFPRLISLDKQSDVIYDILLDIIFEVNTNMARYSLSLPPALKREAEQMAKQQGISLNQFILWSVAEKVGALAQGVDDPDFPGITYRRGTSRQPTPVLRGTGIRVQTIAIAATEWGMSTADIANEYDIPETQIKEAQAFYEAHRTEIDAAIAAEESLAPK
jgi:uncharacterized protein (DUF433 family)